MRLNLSLATLADLPDKVARPAYRREDVSPGILHIGVGNFHRAHQAVYIDDFLNTRQDLNWGIIGAGFRAPDAALRQALKAQDWLTTVVETDADTVAARVTGAMIDVLTVGQDRRNILRALADPRIKIVSLTITEGGYCIDPATGRFNPDHPEVKADAASPQSPSSVFGVLVLALNARREAGIPPFTIMSCDNIPGNGHVTADAITGLANLTDGDLAAWIKDQVAFPNSMVDRITPATSDRERDVLQELYGLQDAWPVFCEPFRQWVMEDRFCHGRPALEEVGVTFTDEVAIFELMKLRMLNGGHAAIAYPAALLGLETAHAAMAHPLVEGFLDRLERDEIIPILPPVPGTDLLGYLDLIKSRFANPKIADSISRLCQDGSNRQPKFILPSAHDRLTKGMEVTGLALVSALWCRYCYGETETGGLIEIDDAKADRLRHAAHQARTTPLAFLDQLQDVFGDVGSNPAFRTLFDASVTKLWQHGTAATIAGYVRDRQTT